MQSMVEGHAQWSRLQEVRITCLCPSTTCGGPPPRFGEDCERHYHPNRASAAASRSASAAWAA